MGGDDQFEIQYLISLIIAVVGAVSVRGISYSIDIQAAHFFLAIAFVHLIVFNIAYTIERATDFQTVLAERYRALQEYTLVAVTIGFIFLVLHMLGLIAISLTSDCSPTINIFQNDPRNLSRCGFAKIVIAYGFPTFIIGMIGWGAVPTVMSTISLFNNIEFTVAPQKVRIFYDYEETEPVLIKVVNQTGEEQEFTLSVDLPEGVTAQYQGTESRETFARNLTIASGKQDVTNLDLRYDGEGRKRDQVEVSVSHEMGDKSKVIDALLVD